MVLSELAFRGHLGETRANLGDRGPSFWSLVINHLEHFSEKGKSLLPGALIEEFALTAFVRFRFVRADKVYAGTLDPFYNGVSQLPETLFHAAFLPPSFWCLISTALSRSLGVLQRPALARSTHVLSILTATTSPV